MRADLSLMGLYDYDTTLFDNMSYPTGFLSADKQNFITNLLFETAELEVLYPSPSFLKMAINAWSKKELPTWNRIYAAAQAEYNPIENYDRQESVTDVTDGTRQHSGTDTQTNSGTDTQTNSGTDTETNSGSDLETNSGKDTTQNSGSDSSTGTGSVTNSGTDVTTNQIAAFNSSTLVDHDKSSLAHGHATSTSDSTSVTHGLKQELTHGHAIATQFGHVIATQHGHSVAMQHGHSIANQHGEKIDDDVTVTHTGRIHGNIGVTTSQQMLEQEIEVAPKLNITNYMIESFKQRFCLLVY